MKRIHILTFIAAVALLSSLCGIFFYQQNYEADPVSGKEISASENFSLENAREALSLCTLSYNSDELKALLEEKGFEEFEYFERAQDTSIGSGIAFGIAKKQEKNHTALWIVIRGTHKGEWYSNFQIGENTEHAGFSSAADYVLAKAQGYIDELKISKENIKLCITGHSRGGAVANICAKRLLDDNSFADVCTYTFACPNTTTAFDAKDKQYTCIYNIVNPEDFICCIPLESWGYTKYGTDIYLPEKGTDNYYELYENMEERFFEIAKRKHKGYPDGDRDVDRFIESLSSTAENVNDYYNKEITMFPTRVTLYEYMQSAAALLAGEDTLANGMILLSGSTSPILSAVTDFITQGISIEEMAENTDLMSSAIGSAHSCETYTAWLQVLNDEYFTSYLPE